MQNQTKREITFGTQLKTALSALLRIKNCVQLRENLGCWQQGSGLLSTKARLSPLSPSHGCLFNLPTHHQVLDSQVDVTFFGSNLPSTSDVIRIVVWVIWRCYNT